MSITPHTFAKAYDELVELGLPARLVVLYGTLEHMVGKNVDCWATHKTLARRCGLKNRRQILRLLGRLHELKLVEWKRGRYYNRYRVLGPDGTWMSNI